MQRRNMLAAFLSLALAFFGALGPAVHAQTFTTPVSGAGASDTRLYTPTTTMRQATNRTHLYGSVSSGYPSAMGRSWQMFYTPARYIQVAFTNWYVDSTTGVETGPGGTSTVRMSIEIPGSGCTQFQWTGSVTASPASGATIVSDVLDLGYYLPAYTKFYVRTYVANATNQMAQSWLGATDVSRGDAFVFSGTDQTASCTTVTDTGSATYALHPAAVMTYSNRKVWMGLGDSTTAGIGDTFNDSSGGQGNFGRSMATFGPTVNFGAPGDRAAWFVASHAKRVALATTAGVSAGINAYGINDLIQGRTAVQLAADRESIRGYFTGLPIFDATVPPYTTSSDGWKTASGQTVGTGNAARITYNGGIRAGVTTSPGYVDRAALVETSTTSERVLVLNGGVWMPGDTGDGIHFTSPAYQLTNDSFDNLLAVTAP